MMHPSPPRSKARLAAGLLCAFTALWPKPAGAADAAGPGNQGMVFSGLGWVQYGMVAHSTDTLNLNTNGNALQTSGAQISLYSRISDRLTGKAGLGVTENLPMAGGIEGGGRVPTYVTPYIAEASFNYRFLDSQGSQLALTGGLFHYDYSPDIQNLGLYLLRGPVYPGVVISGFETKDVLPIANMLGFQLHHSIGDFQQDLILNSETELHPYFDISLAYIARYQAGKALRIGGGINFYHLIPIDSKLTSPSLDSTLLAKRKEKTEDQVKSPYDRVMIYVDTTGPGRDTTMLSFKGTKVMADFSFDPKAFWDGNGRFGPEDLKIYGEAALIGLDFSKAYTQLYGDWKHRMPIMVGFNLPVFKWLDHLSLEAEWYGAKFRDDYSRYRPGASYFESPIPVSNSFLHRTAQEYTDPVTGEKRQVVAGTTVPFDQANVEKNQFRDNWKWSLHGSRIILDHFKVSFQVADDHLRPGGSQDQPSFDAILTTPKDWYWMTRIGYFF